MGRPCAKGLHDLDIEEGARGVCKACKREYRQHYDRIRLHMRVRQGRASMTKEQKRAVLTNRINALRERVERETRKWLQKDIEAELDAARAEMLALDGVVA